MRGKNILWLAIIAMLAITAIISAIPVQAQTETMVYVDPSLVETKDARFHYPVVGELVGVETWTVVTGELLGIGDRETTVFSLDNAPVVPESETIYVRGVPQTRDVDYTIDYMTGTITFTEAPKMNREITADYTYYIPEFHLSETPVDLESETIYLDTVPQTRDVDYTIDYMTGTITFLIVPSDSAEITADYSWWDTIFSIDIKIANVIDLWAFGFTLDFAPYTSVLNIIDVIEGDFLSEGAGPGEKTWFTHSVDTFKGELYVGCTRKRWTVTGVKGNGTLVTVVFDIVEAGRSPLDLLDVKLINSALLEIPILPENIISGAYHGPIALLKHPSGGITKRKSKVGEVKTFSIKVKNPSNATLYVKVRFTFQREDGQAAYIWTGQSYTGFGPKVVDVAYVDGYYPWLEWGWINSGASLIGPPDGIYTESYAHCDITSMYTFEDIDTMGRIVENVEFYAYSKCGDTASDIDSYIWTYDEAGNTVMSWAWGNSQGGTLDWAWTNKKYYWPAYNFPEYYGDHILTQQGINSAEMLLHNYHGDTGQMIDAYKMEVTYSKYTPAQGAEAVYVIQPGEAIELPPAVWFLSSYDVGKFYATATLFYSYWGEWFVRGQRTSWGSNPPEITFSFDVEP